jgi:hypothetical protein
VFGVPVGYVRCSGKCVRSCRHGSESKLASSLTRADRLSPCRWHDNGDGTATDLNNGLQWDLRRGEAVDNRHHYRHHR